MAKYVVCVKPPGLNTWLAYLECQTMSEAEEEATMLRERGMMVPGGWGRQRMPAKVFVR